MFKEKVRLGPRSSVGIALLIRIRWAYNPDINVSQICVRGFLKIIRRVEEERTVHMDNSELIELNIEVSASDASEDDIDRMTRHLLSELRDLDVESAQLAKGGPAPVGSKGDAITMGAIVLELLPAVLPSVLGLIQSWVARGRGRTIIFKGMGIEFEGSSEELQKILEMLSKGGEK